MKRKRLLFITQYYPPEVGAPQNRLSELAKRLMEEIDVEVLTATPNYPKMEVLKGYKNKLFFKEEIEGIKIYRSWIYISKSRGIITRLLNYFSFVFSSLFVGVFRLKKQYDIVLCESPPLFLGISALIISRFNHSKFIFNVSDLWPESAEKLGIISNKFFLNLATVLEEIMYRSSNLVTGQTQGISKKIKTRFPKKDVYWLPNGVDISFYDPDKIKSNWREQNGFKNDQILFFYGGILGHAQGLEVILNAAKELHNQKELQFILLGSGPEEEKLKNLKENLELENVHFFEGVSKSQMPEIIKAIDVSIVPLKKLDLFKGAIPSKIFEILSMKKPILLGVEGEAKDLFIEKGNAGWFFEPENSQALSKQCLRLLHNQDEISKKGLNGRNYISQNFDRHIIASKFLKKLQSI